MGSTELLCGPKSEIVIEGFPRSGNSFAKQAFMLANPQVNSIATHLHVPANALIGVRLAKPVVVLIRKPVDAVLSLLALTMEVNHREGRDRAKLSFGCAFKEYYAFYRTLLPYSQGIVFASFETVSSDFGLVIDQVNSRFGTQFFRFSHTEENLNCIRTKAGYHALPNDLRDEIKETIKEEFERERGSVEKEISRAYEQYELVLPLATK